MLPSWITTPGQYYAIVFANQDQTASESAYQNDSLHQAFTVTSLCFLVGTYIATLSGQVPVEHLEVGDVVLTAAGGPQLITWIGVGRTLATRGRRGAATPVIVRKGALADNVPYQDLRVTKGHSFWFDGVLIPVEFLVNHRSILWDDHAQEVNLYHIELADHDVLLANGAPAESYRDDGNRWLFQNANSGWNQQAKPPCAPVLTGGPVVDSVWRGLLGRSGPRPALPLTDETDAHLMIEGRRENPFAQYEQILAFRLSAPAAPMHLMSRSASPQELGLCRDPRLLGLAVRQVRVYQGVRLQVVEAEDPDLFLGFHDYEEDGDLRWTDGDAILPSKLFAGFEGTVTIEIHLCGTTQYAADKNGRAVA